MQEIPVVDISKAIVTFSTPRGDDILLRSNKNVKIQRLFLDGLLYKINSAFESFPISPEEKREYIYKMADRVLNQSGVIKGYMQ
jgi:hypothetical protein